MGMRKHSGRTLDEANKLIFAKRYAEAETVLDELLRTKEAVVDMRIHLRRIELATMLKKLGGLRVTYKISSDSMMPSGFHELCLLFIDQAEEAVTTSESISSFQEHMRRFGPSAGAYYGIGYSMEQQKNFDRAIFNYDQALKIDPEWYLAYFGLSQSHYQLGHEKDGDHFFYLFEQAAPYNVYGNFETHRRLYHEFIARERYHEAESAIQTLSEWWKESKGSCPIEIQIYELLATAKISDLCGDTSLGLSRRTRAGLYSREALEDPKTSENVLYFIAKILEEFDDYKQAFVYYKRILRGVGENPALVQKIGSQFISMGEYGLAKELFEEAYEVHPENQDIRFCLLVTGLKLKGVNVEDYLIGRERLRQLLDGNGDKVEILALLHSLIAKFEEDAEVQGHIADLYLKLSNIERATRHYELMYLKDHKNRQSALKYAAFIMQYKDPEEAIQILSNVNNQDTLPSEAQAEIFWLKANYFARKKDYRESQAVLRRVLAMDPWNVSYLVQEIINLIHTSSLDAELTRIDPILQNLTTTDESQIDWTEFDLATKRIESQHAYELVYSRCKLKYLYASGTDETLLELVKAACRFDASRATYDFIRLLNTNFDSPSIYWALGIIFKELWRLETAAVWFEQMLLFPAVSQDLKAKAYLELADSFIWQGRNLPKAIEYAKVSLDMDNQKNSQALRVLAHAHLKSGQIRQAKIYLDQTDSDSDHEVRYLRGLLFYRNGDHLKANEIWKPLLTVRTESLRFHNIKQEVLKFYFDGAPYLKAN
jgi:tetratricopeptide (TPR) repeat protein